METLDGTLKPIELVFNSGDLITELDKISLLHPGEHLIGLCFRRYPRSSMGFPKLVIEPVLLNPGRDGTRLIQILDDSPIQLAFRGMNSRDSYYNWANPLDRAVLFSHIDFS